MKRKKWTEAEEATLISAYAELSASGAIPRLGTRERRLHPVAERVNSLHHEVDPTSYPFRRSWRDVSVKIQNMRNQYLNLKRKIFLPDGSNSLDWDLGLHLWPNFLRYKHVFGDHDPPTPAAAADDDGEEKPDPDDDDARGIDDEEEDDEGEEKRRPKARRALALARRIVEVGEVAVAREEGRRRGREEEEEEEEEVRRRRRRREERREEEEREWVERVVGMQMEHERAVMQMQGEACQMQLQAACVLARVVFQLLGPVLGDAAIGGAMPPPHPHAHAGMMGVPGEQQDRGSMGAENGKSDTSSPGQYL